VQSAVCCFLFMDFEDVGIYVVYYKDKLTRFHKDTESATSKVLERGCIVFDAMSTKSKVVNSILTTNKNLCSMSHLLRCGIELFQFFIEQLS